MTEASFIRNFAIIAHIDHGKSTLADRLIEACGALSGREMVGQVLDNMDLERERGITIKAQTVRLVYQEASRQARLEARAGEGNGKTPGPAYVLNLLDTPGHVDFSYEVSRSLAACEGALLVVDATQGVEAQTLVNSYLALERNIEMIPVLNKIDLPAADVDGVKKQLAELVGLDPEEAILVSAKSGTNISQLLEAIVARIRPPEPLPDPRLKALLIDSWYDVYLGVIVIVRVFAGVLKKGMKVRMMHKEREYVVESVGYFMPKPKPSPAGCLYAGEIGFLTASIKTVADCKIGDTLTEARNPVTEALPGFRPSLPVVFCGFFPVDSDQYETLQDGLTKLALNDASFHYEVESSPALGLGYRCGFLGLLHLEIIQERLQREFGVELVTTAPSVVYELILTNSTQMLLHNPADFPDQTRLKDIKEPWLKATITTPARYLGAILPLCSERRGQQLDLVYHADRVILTYALPLNEVVFDFYDRLKSASSGYASFDYELTGSRSGDMVRVNILVNGKPVDAFAMILHRSRAERQGRRVCEKLKTLIPRQLYKVAIQATIGGKIIARETVQALRKDVTAKCYGGDITRKRKLLEKQKKGKKKMRQFGDVEIPQSAFLKALKFD